MKDITLKRNSFKDQEDFESILKELDQPQQCQLLKIEINKSYTVNGIKDHNQEENKKEKILEYLTDLKDSELYEVLQKVAHVRYYI
jgi:hypothetical protein